MLPKTGRVFPNDGEVAYALAISAALRAELGDGHRAAKTVMRWTGASERSAKGWISGRTGPSGPHLILLARESDGVARAILSLANRKSLAAGMQLQIAKQVLVATVQLLNELTD